MRGNRPEYKVCYQATEHSRAAHHERSVKWSSGTAEQQQQDASALVNVKKHGEQNNVNQTGILISRKRAHAFSRKNPSPQPVQYLLMRLALPAWHATKPYLNIRQGQSAEDAPLPVQDCHRRQSVPVHRRERTNHRLAVPHRHDGLNAQTQRPHRPVHEGAHRGGAGPQVPHRHALRQHAEKLPRGRVHDAQPVNPRRENAHCLQQWRVTRQREQTLGPCVLDR